MNKLYGIYINYDGAMYRITTKPGFPGFTFEDACNTVDDLTDYGCFGAEVIHEPSNDRFYLGIPYRAMEKVIFFAKELPAT